MKLAQTKDTAPLTASDLARLRLTRVQNGWSYREMADRIGIPEPTLHKVMEELVSEPRETTVYRIRQWLMSYRAVAS